LENIWLIYQDFKNNPLICFLIIPMIDLTFLSSFAGGDKAKMAKYIGIFMKSFPGLLQMLETKLEAADYPGVRTAAHSLKPQITYMGIKSLEDLVKTIEHTAGSATELDQLPSRIATLKAGILDAAKELEQELAKLQG
jgi:HPt (histidine-containing phosphotransfer) domain-containing protein